MNQDRTQRAFAQNDAKFKELFGVKKETFRQMLDVLTVAREQRRRKGGPRPKLTPADQLFMALQYWREYRTMEHIAHDFGVRKSTVSATIAMVENTLIQDERFHLPGKKALTSKENEGRTFAVDVTESPIARPKKNKKTGTRARKSDTRCCKKQGAQIIADIETQEIICTDQDKGGIHDFKLFKRSVRAILWGVLLLADSGYQGLLGLHKNSRIPHKSSKKRPLTEEQKSFNRELSSERIVIENINARRSCFPIIQK